MLPRFLQKLNSPSGHSFKVQTHFDPSEFIPYAAFYNAHTLITKNGELLTQISISHNAQGDINEASADVPSLRSLIREALKSHVDSEEIAVWCHTSRVREPIVLTTAVKNAFLDGLHQYWHGATSFTHSFKNVVTLTFLHQAQHTKLFDVKEFKQSRNLASNRAFRLQALEEQASHLAQVVQGVVDVLSPHYKARQLGLREEATGKGSEYFSESLEFLSTLTALRTQAMPVVDSDLSHALYSHKLIFGHNALESRGVGNKRYAAVLTLKHYHELPSQQLDSLLQLPVEMIVSESVEFIPAEDAVTQHQALAEIYKTSNNPVIAKASGTAGMFEAFQNKPSDYAKHQISFLVTADDLISVEEGCATLQNTAGSLGLVLIREDIRLEESFWSMLPGNFPFLRRQYPTHTRHVMGMARLNYYPVGEAESPWGRPVMVLPTQTHTPYLFHWYHGGSGHTCLLDYNSFPDHLGTRALNLLIGNTRRNGHRVIMIEQTHKHELLTSALGGNVVGVGGARGVKLNPCTLDDTPRNRGFLAAWIAFVLGLDDSDEATKQQLKSAVDITFNGGTSRTLENIVQHLANQGQAALADKLRSLIHHPAFASVFDASTPAIDMTNPMLCVQLRKSQLNTMALSSAFALLLHQLILTLDGKPCLLVLSDGFDLCNNAFIAPRLQSLLAMLDQQNVAVVFATSAPEKAVETSVSNTIANTCATKIIVPDDVPVASYAEHLQLLPQTRLFIDTQDRQKGECVIQQGASTIPVYLTMDWPEHLAHVLDNHSSQSTG